MRSAANGGVEDVSNLEAWCARCNLTQGKADAGDPRFPPREWQLDALETVIPALVRTRAATVSAAPGAGKTVFAGLVFEAMRDLGLVDRVVNEPVGGAQRDPRVMARLLRRALGDALRQLQGLTPEELVEQRIERLMSFGRYQEVKA